MRTAVGAWMGSAALAVMAGVAFAQTPEAARPVVPPAADLAPDAEAPAEPQYPLAIATSEGEGSPAANAIDGDPSTAWRTTAAGEQGLMVDFGEAPAFGGLTLTWAEGGAATRYRLMASSDGEAWTAIAQVEAGDGGTDWLRTPDASARYLRLDLSAPPVASRSPGQRRPQAQTSYALSELAVEPVAFGKDETAFLSAVAAESRRGLYPRALVGEQNYWTLVAVDGGGESGRMSEDGAIELRRGGPSIEPFVLDNGQLVTWADVQIQQGLVQTDLPIPTVTWTHAGWTLKVTALADAGSGAVRLYGRYDLTNTSDRPQTLTLALAARALQVRGPASSLSAPGGASPLAGMDWRDGRLVLTGVSGAVDTLSPFAAPDRLSLSAFEAGADPQSLIAAGRGGAVSQARHVSDNSGLPGGALLYDVTLQPGETRTLGFVSDANPAGAAQPRLDPGALNTVQARVAAGWRETLDRFDLILPPEGQGIEDAVKTSLAHMLMSRHGPRLQPGADGADRSGIRDGAMMADALNRLGHAELSAQALRLYASPATSDAEGVDGAVANGGEGEFIFLAAETWRYTHDAALLRAVWPQVQAAIVRMDGLRASTRVPANRTRETRHLYGLLPASQGAIADAPAYRFQDDFWGLRGYKDAVFIAEALGETAAAARFAASRDQFQADLRNAITGTAIHHHVGFIAGAADRGDFDPVSIALALSPAGAQADLPQGLLKSTFEHYWEIFSARQDAGNPWDDYNPHEVRNVGALVRLGQRDRALRALDVFLADRRPLAWSGWPSLVGRDLRQPRIVGDMPDAGVSADYMRSALDLFVYERESDQTLVLAGGLPLSWLDAPTGVGVRGLRTPYGLLTYGLRRQAGSTVLTLEPGVRPPGGFVIQWPADAELPGRVRADGRRFKWKGREVVIPATARRVEFR